jgi:CTP:molybdopterin cytidylyltransferase MocA
MTHSLQLADAAAPAGRPLAVLLGDKPLLRAALIDVVAAHVGDGIDLAYPVGNDGVPGHPVVFGVRARARIASLPPGDTLKLLRDDPTLVAAKVAVDDAGAFVDIDSEADYRRLLDDRGGLSR